MPAGRAGSAGVDGGGGGAVAATIEARQAAKLPVWVQFKINGRMTWYRGVVLWKVKVCFFSARYPALSDLLPCNV